MTGNISKSIMNDQAKPMKRSMDQDKTRGCSIDPKNEMGDTIDTLTPDSMTGLILGFEGIRNAMVLLNGPTGCKFYHGITAENQAMRRNDMDPLNYTEEWFFGQNRVPCTYLDKRDYVYGSEDKLKDAIPFVLSHSKCDLLAVINTPGAALIGDDLERIVRASIPDGSDIKIVTCESPGYSRNITDGYKEAAKLAADLLAGNAKCDTYDQILPGHLSEASNPKRSCCESSDTGYLESFDKDINVSCNNGSRLSYDTGNNVSTVNLIGLSIYHKYHIGDGNEIRRLLSLSGIKVKCALLNECTTNEITGIGEADLNIVIDPDYGIDIADYLKDTFGTPYICCSDPLKNQYSANMRTDNTSAAGATSLSSQNDISSNAANQDKLKLPIGFDATEKLLKSVEKALSHRHEVDISPALEDIEKARAQAYIQLSRISSVTGLPKGVTFKVHGSRAVVRSYSSFLTEYLGMTEVSEDANAEIILADGNTIASLRAGHPDHRFCGIEISLPAIGYVDVIPKTHLGSTGALFLIEQILNGLNF